MRDRPGVSDPFQVARNDGCWSATAAAPHVSSLSDTSPTSVTTPSLVLFTLDLAAMWLSENYIGFSYNVVRFTMRHPAVSSHPSSMLSSCLVAKKNRLTTREAPPIHLTSLLWAPHCQSQPVGPNLHQYCHSKRQACLQALLREEQRLHLLRLPLNRRRQVLFPRPCLWRQTWEPIRKRRNSLPEGNLLDDRPSGHSRGIDVNQSDILNAASQTPSNVLRVIPITMANHLCCSA